VEAHTQNGEVIKIGDQLVRFDRSCTEQGYAHIATPGPEECGCSMCRNFIVQRSTAFPESFLALLHRLGIDHAKEGEVYYLGPGKQDKRLYGGWFFFCGELVEVGEQQTSIDGISYSVIGPGKIPSPNPRDRFDPNPLALDFYFEIPWVLPDEDPEARPSVSHGANQ
jgi:hypothetical protein